MEEEGGEGVEKQANCRADKREGGGGGHGQKVDGIKIINKC